MKSFLTYAGIGFGAAILIYLLIYSFKQTPATDASQKIAEAEANYSLGEKAASVFDRKKAFNISWQDYSQLEKTFHPEYGNGKIYYDLGNVNYQLGEYPWAVYYYNKALQLMPRDEETAANLATALKKLDIKPEEGYSAFEKVFFFHSLFSLPERLTFFFFTSLALILAISAYIWTKKHWLQFIIALLGAAILLLFGSLMYSRFMLPIEGVLIRAAVLHRDAGDQYAKVSEQPIKAGNKVQVLDIRQGGDWLKIMSPDGKIGYIKQEQIRLI